MLQELESPTPLQNPEEREKLKAKVRTHSSPAALRMTTDSLARVCVCPPTSASRFRPIA